jgi:hypothetical protein
MTLIVLAIMVISRSLMMTIIYSNCRFLMVLQCPLTTCFSSLSINSYLSVSKTEFLKKSLENNDLDGL